MCNARGCSLSWGIGKAQVVSALHNDQRFEIPAIKQDSLAFQLQVSRPKCEDQVVMGQHLLNSFRFRASLAFSHGESLCEHISSADFKFKWSDLTHFAYRERWL
jgi:hypothetical protein